MGGFVCLFPSGSCWSTEAYPGRFAGLLADDQPVVCDTLAHMASTWRTWQEARDVQDRLVQDWRREGYVRMLNGHWVAIQLLYFWLVLCRILFRSSRAGGADPGGGLCQQLDQGCGGRLQGGESKNTLSRRPSCLSPQATWRAPIQRQVFSKLHRYQEIEHADMDLFVNGPRKIPHSLYTREGKCQRPSHLHHPVHQAEGRLAIVRICLSFHWPWLPGVL